MQLTLPFSVGWRETPMWLALKMEELMICCCMSGSPQAPKHPSGQACSGWTSVKVATPYGFWRSKPHNSTNPHRASENVFLYLRELNAISTVQQLCQIVLGLFEFMAYEIGPKNIFIDKIFMNGATKCVDLDSKFRAPKFTLCNDHSSCLLEILGIKKGDPFIADLLWGNNNFI